MLKLKTLLIGPGREPNKITFWVPFQFLGNVKLIFAVIEICGLYQGNLEQSCQVYDGGFCDVDTANWTEINVSIHLGKLHGHQMLAIIARR